jgi:hypothetical protein
VTTWPDVLRVALTLPETEESTSYRMPCAKVRGRTFLNMSPHEDGALVLRCPVEERELLLAARPDLYFVTPHYAASDCVLTRLEAIDGDELAGRVEDAYAFVVDKYRLRAG